MTNTPRTDEAFASCCTLALLTCSRELETENATLKARIAELTEWRPMETVPEGMCILRDYNGYITLGNGIRASNTKLLGTDELWHKGWLPLPEE